MDGAPHATEGSVLKLSQVARSHQHLEELSAPWREHRELHTAKPSSPKSICQFCF